MIIDMRMELLPLHRVRQGDCPKGDMPALDTTLPIEHQIQLPTNIASPLHFVSPERFDKSSQPDSFLEKIILLPGFTMRCAHIWADGSTCFHLQRRAFDIGVESFVALLKLLCFFTATCVHPIVLSAHAMEIRFVQYRKRE